MPTPPIEKKRGETGDFRILNIEEPLASFVKALSGMTSEKTKRLNPIMEKNKRNKIECTF